MSRKAELGIGTLIVFITFLLIAVSVSSLLLSAAGEVHERELIAMKQAQTQVSTNIRVVEVSGTDARDGIINNLSMIMKLAAGSEDIKFEDAFLMVITNEGTATLRYGGKEAHLANRVGGYWTLTERTAKTEMATRDLSSPTITRHPLLLDYDWDNGIDHLIGGLEGSMAFLELSSANQVRLGYCNTSAHFVTHLSDTTYVTRSQDDPSTCSGTNLTALLLERQTSPHDHGKGFYAVEYLQRGTNPSLGTMQRGDVIRIHLQPPEQIGTQEKVTLRFVAKYGTPTITQFTTPQGMAEERVYLYP